MAQIEIILAAVTALLMTVWLADSFLPAGPASRDLLWRTALVLVAITPAIVFLRGIVAERKLPLYILPALQNDEPRIKTEDLASQSPRQVLPHPASNRSGPLGKSSPTRPQSVATNSIASGGPAVRSPLAVAETPAAKPAHREGGLPWLIVVGSVWMAGCLAQGARILRAARNAHALTTAARPVTDPALIDLNRWAAACAGLPRPAALLSSPEIDGPVVSGLFRPKIIVPHCLLRADARTQVRAAMLHEAGHVRRHDLAFDLLLKLVMAAFWPHPLVHVMAGRLRRLREEICDNYVLSQESPDAYAETLLQLSIGMRLAETPLAGLGMFARQHPLEDRVNGLLAPGRLLERQASRGSHWVALCAAGVLLATPLVVRLERASGASPVPKTALAQQMQAGPKAPPRRSNVGVQAVPRVYLFRVVTTKGKPVVGAKVVPFCVTANGGRSFCFDPKTSPEAVSDSAGVARVRLTKDEHDPLTPLIRQTEEAGIILLSLRVDHPDHPVWFDHVAVLGDRRIVLADSTTIAVRARREGEREWARGLYPVLSHSSFADPADVDWSEENGVLTIRRVDVASEAKGSRWLRIVQAPRGDGLKIRVPYKDAEHRLEVPFPNDREAWFSELIDLTQRAGNPIALDVSLKPAAVVAGQLAANVPRPVKTGRVVAQIVHGPKPWTNNWQWNAVSSIDGQGRFVFRSIPPDENLQIVALCDGWVSSSPTAAETNAYSAKHGFPGPNSQSPAAGFVLPRLYRVDKDLVRVVTPMEPAATCEVTVLDQRDRPIPNATVMLPCGEMIHNGGTSAVGWGVDQLAQIQAQLAGGDHRKGAEETWLGRKFSAITNARGIAIVSDLPGGGYSPDTLRQVELMVNHDDYVPLPNSQMPLSYRDEGRELPLDRLLVPALWPGNTAHITVRMIPRPGSGSQADAGLQPVAKPAIQTAGSEIGKDEVAGKVVDEQGKPIEGVQVHLWHGDLDKIRTDKGGRFRHKLAANEAGFDAYVRFVKPGYAPQLNLNWPTGTSDKVVILDTKTYFEGIVRRSDGKPAANVLIRANQGDRQSIGRTSTETRTDAAGLYRLLVQPDVYEIEVRDPVGGTVRVPKPATTANAPAATGAAELRIGDKEAKHLDLRLEPGVPFRARIVDSVTGRPVQGVRLSDWQWQYPGIERTSDAAGHVRISSLPPGNFAFKIEANGYLRAWSEEAPEQWKHERKRSDGAPMAPMEDGVPFSLAPEMAEVTIRLEPAVTLTGHVLDPEGRPAAGCTVQPVLSGQAATWTDGSGEVRYTTLTAKDGAFTLQLPPNGNRNCNLMAHDGVFREWRKWANGIGEPIKTAPGQRIDNIELRLSRPGTIRGRVVDKAGQPAPGVDVQCTAADGRENNLFNPSTRSGRDGEFELRFVRPCRQLVHDWRGLAEPGRWEKNKKVRAIDVRSGEASLVGDVFIEPAVY